MPLINEFAATIYALMDSGQYGAAKRIIMKKLKVIKGQRNNTILLAEIAGFLIDTGCDQMDGEPTETGVSLMEETALSSKDD